VGDVEVAVTSRTSTQFYKEIHIFVSLLDLNDNSPRFDPAAVEFTISEDYRLLGTSRTLPSATDDDVGENARLSFEVRWNGSAEGKLDFRVAEREDGTAVLSLVKVGELDRETRDTYAATVIAVDAGTPPLTGSLDVLVRVGDANDHSPVFESELYEATIREDLPAGATVAQLRAVDADAGPNGAVRYHFSEGTSVFTVDELTGAVTLRSRLDSRPKGGAFRLRVAAVDQAADVGMRRVAYTRLVINVVDTNNHAPTIRLLHGGRLEVVENQPAGAQVRVTFVKLH